MCNPDFPSNAVIQLNDQVLRDADIALKQGHNDVTILTPSAIAIEVS